MRRPCIEPGCNQTGTGPRCPTHQHHTDTAKNQRRQQQTTGAAAHWRHLLQQHGGAICAHCQQPHHRDNLEVDHIKPLADGGTDSLDNLQILCTDCHRSKSAAEHRARVQANPEHTQLGS
jgi:5-methylcytosine-specific restriction protein A